MVFSEESLIFADDKCNIKFYSMKNKTMLCMLCAVMAVMSSCEKFVESAEGFGNLKVKSQTRDDDNVVQDVAQGNIFVFNNQGALVEVKAISNSQASFNLPVGSYQLTAVGGDNLTVFNLPTGSGTTTESLITLKENESMSDLQMKQKNVTLVEGDRLDQPMELERKVTCIESVEVTGVPVAATNVSLEIGPFYDAVKLDGTYANSVANYQVALAVQNDGTTWKALPNQLLFPSNGFPSIKITITDNKGFQQFSFTASEAMLANHKYKICGSYETMQGGVVSASLSAVDWAESSTIAFGFDEQNYIYEPVARQKCNGYYVVSVNESARTAVLWAKKRVEYTAPASSTDSPEWRSALNAAMSALAKPAGVEGTWRLPTLAELSICCSDENMVSYSSEGYSPLYLCLDGDVLKWGYVKHISDTYQTKSGTDLGGEWLRPVIDIHY